MNVHDAYREIASLRALKGNLDKLIEACSTIGLKRLRLELRHIKGRIKGSTDRLEEYLNGLPALEKPVFDMQPPTLEIPVFGMQARYVLYEGCITLHNVTHIAVMDHGILCESTIHDESHVMNQDTYLELRVSIETGLAETFYG
jgi:hypothetical protein